MVGIAGCIGRDQRRLSRLVEDLRWSGEEVTATDEDERLAVGVATHDDGAKSQPARTSDGAAVWLWGSVWGFDGPDGYEVVDAPAADFCASQYEQHGAEFVAGLNGNFVGLVADPGRDRVSLFTDRLATRPVYYATTDDAVVFSTNVQSLPHHPAVPAAFDVGYLAEYFAMQRTFGVKTPLEGVEKLQPGALTHVDGGDVAVESYWEPHYDPVDRPRSYFTRRLAELLKRAVAERTDPDAEYGLLLSGGSDSRLVLAALTAAGASVHAYHLNEWRNEEARVAERVADDVGAEFTMLRRDADYLARTLDSTPAISNFVGYFNEAHAAGFRDTITADVDELYTGHYGDALFKGHHLPRPRIELGGVGSFELPMEQRIDTVDAFVDHRVSDAPAYIADALPGTMRDTYAANVHTDGRRLVDHGVSYRSPREAVICSRYPLTNSPSQFFYHGTLQMLPTGTPFLDNRLIDLFLSIPTEHLLRGNIITGAIEHIDPGLAAIPHGETGVPLSYSFPAQWLGNLATSFKRRHLSDSPPEPHWTQGPWPDHNEAIRSHGFVRDTLDEHEDVVRRLPFLSWDGVQECYDAHLAGEDNLAALYTLVTFLRMPLTRRAVREDPPPA